MQTQPRSIFPLPSKFTLAIAILLSCIAVDVLASSSEPLAFIERRGYSPFCPTYDLRVFSDGNVLYRGYANVSDKGERQRQLDSRVVDDIKSALGASGVQSVRQDYVPDRRQRTVIDCKKDAELVAKRPKYSELCKTRDKFEVTVGVRTAENEDKILYRIGARVVAVEIAKTAPNDRERVQSLFRRVEELAGTASWVGRDPCP